MAAAEKYFPYLISQYVLVSRNLKKNGFFLHAENTTHDIFISSFTVTKTVLPATKCYQNQIHVKYQSSFAKPLSRACQIGLLTPDNFALCTARDFHLKATF